jgi:hypothetical protein
VNRRRGSGSAGSAPVTAAGGSTSAVLHILAIANEVGIAVDIDADAIVFARTAPVACARLLCSRRGPGTSELPAWRRG